MMHALSRPGIQRSAGAFVFRLFICDRLNIGEDGVRFFRGLILLALMAMALSASAATLQELGELAANFYLKPSPPAFDALQQGADEHQAELVGASNGAEILVAVEIARIAQKHGWKPGNGYFGKMAQEFLEGRTERARMVADDSRLDPGRLDIWWASFGGTGDEQYLEKIFRFAGQPLPKGNVPQLMLIGSATWSFKSNCLQHAAVRDFARRKLAQGQLTEARQQYLRECLEAPAN